jgi:hypothetical protein
MDAIFESLRGAAALIASGDPTLADIVVLSLKVSLSAVVFATLLGLPIGAAISVSRFPGRIDHRPERPAGTAAGGGGARHLPAALARRTAR